MISLLELPLQPARFNASRPKMCSDGTHLAVSRELVAMSDWERGLASSLGFDHDRRNVATASLGSVVRSRRRASLSG